MENKEESRYKDEVDMSEEMDRLKNLLAEKDKEIENYKEAIELSLNEKESCKVLMERIEEMKKNLSRSNEHHDLAQNNFLRRLPYFELNAMTTLNKKEGRNK